MEIITHQHIVYYKGAGIHYCNGLYQIADLPFRTFFTIDEAKAVIDKIERSLSPDISKFFDNLKISNAKTTNAER